MCASVSVCVCVCLFFVPYTPPQFSVDLHEIWHVAPLYPTDDRGALASAARACALHAVHIHSCKWVASSIGQFGTRGQQM